LPGGSANAPNPRNDYSAVDFTTRLSRESVVEADRCGESEEACADAGSEAVEGAGAVPFEAEQVFAGLEDRFDSLADRGQVGASGALVFAAWPDDCGVEVGSIAS